MDNDTPKSLQAMQKFAETYAQRTNTFFCSDLSVTSIVIEGLARHKDEYGAPLCPCRHYDDKAAEVSIPRATVSITSQKSSCWHYGVVFTVLSPVDSAPCPGPNFLVTLYGLPWLSVNTSPGINSSPLTRALLACGVNSWVFGS